MTKEERKIITRKLERAYALYADFKHMCARNDSTNALGVTQNDVHAAEYEYNGVKSVAYELGFNMDEIRSMEDRIREEKWNYYMRGESEMMEVRKMMENRVNSTRDGVYHVFGDRRYYTVRNVGHAYMVYAHSAHGRIISRKLFSFADYGARYHQAAVRYASHKATGFEF